MSQTSGTMECKPAAAPAILAQFGAVDCSSPASLSLSLGRALEQLNQALGLAGSAVVVSAGKDFTTPGLSRPHGDGDRRRGWRHQGGDGGGSVPGRVERP